MALSGVIKTAFDAGTLVASDGTGTPLTCTIRFDNANLQVSGIRQGLRGTTAYQGRGKLRSLRKTAREFPTLSFSVQVSDFSETSTGTLVDLILGKSGTPYASRLSTTAAKGDVITLDIAFTQEGTNYGDSADQAITFEDVELTFDFAEGDPNTITFNGVIYGAFTGGIAIAVDA